jgi:hypothetical protein
MLHVEYVQSGSGVRKPSEGGIQTHLLAETRPVLKDNRREAHIWVFALTDSTSAMERISEGFRAAPMNQPLGVSVDQIVQTEAHASESNGLLVCALCFDRAVVAHNGDACCYLIRHNHATRLTLGNVRLIDYQIQPGDVLLLSGSSLQSIKGSEMAEIAGHRVDLAMAAQKLTELARQRGEGDSHFDVVMIRILSVERSNRTQSERARSWAVRARA